MSKFTLEFDTDNDEFQEPGADIMQRISEHIRRVAGKIETYGSTYGQINDINGNKIGEFSHE